MKKKIFYAFLILSIILNFVFSYQLLKAIERTNDIVDLSCKLQFGIIEGIKSLGGKPGYESY
jgi:hypothetical protein